MFPLMHQSGLTLIIWLLTAKYLDAEIVTESRPLSEITNLDVLHLSRTFRLHVRIEVTGISQTEQA